MLQHGGFWHVKLVIDYQIHELKLGLYNIEKIWKKTCNEYQVILQKIWTGKIGDEDDYMIWAGIYEMFLRDKQKLENLQW